MWKGEKEYQLVAGGEELFQENGLLAHKSVPERMAPSDVRVKEELKEMQSPFARRSPSDGGDFPSDGEGTDFDTLHSLSLRNERTQGTHLATMRFAHPSQQPRSVVKDEACDLHLPFPSSIPPVASIMAPSVSPPHVVRNNVTAVSLGAASMPPLLVEVDRYAPPSPSLPGYPPRVSIYFKLSLSSLHDVSSPPALHGFSGTVTFAAPWTSVAQCVTRVFAGGVCESEEYAYFDPITPLSPISMTPVTVPLPESELSRCRWGIGVQTRIDQVITVDHEELAWITYDLTWTASGPPTAEVLSVQWDSSEHQPPPPAAAPTPVPEPAPFLSLNSWNPPFSSYVPRSQELPITYPPYSSFGCSSSGDQQQYTHYSSSVLFS